MGRRVVSVWLMVVAFSIALTVTTGTPSAQAQSTASTVVTGRLLQRDSSSALARAIVELRNADGEVIRSLSGSDGTFRVTLAEQGQYTLRVLRVGFLPFSGPILDARGLPITLRPLVVASPQVLLAATSQSSRSCTIDRDDGLAVAAAWEEARKAMLTATLQEGDGRPDALEGEWMTYERLLDASGMNVRTQRVDVRTSYTQRVFRSAPIDSILRNGFVGNSDDGIAYHVPDAEVLLSPLFSATHCFTLDSRAPANKVHVGFDPSPDAAIRYDVSGTAVLDRSSGLLETIRFRYTGLPDTPDALAGGGEVHFTRLSDGRWVVSKWTAQLPIHRAAARAAAPGTRTSRSGRSAAVVAGLHQTGGNARILRLAADTLLNVPLPTLRVQLVGSEPSLFAGRARVMLDSTTLDATVDSTGFALLSPLPPGRYTLRVAVPLRDSLGASRLTSTVTVHEPHRSSQSATERVDTIRVPDIASTIRTVCPTVDSTTGSAVLRGWLRLEDGRPGSHLRVALDYLRADARRLATTGEVRWQPERRETTTDENGRFGFCGVPRNTDLHLEGIAPLLRQRGAQRLRLPLAQYAQVGHRAHAGEHAPVVAH
jgi:hypothetical protein